MTQKAHLFLTLSRGGWGEATFAIRLASQLAEMGENAVFLTHSRNLPLFVGTGLSHFPIGDHIGPLAFPLITETARDHSAKSIVLCDFLTADGMLRQWGVDASRLLQSEFPIVSIDTWGHSLANGEIDLFSDRKLKIRDWIRDSRAIRPCPLHRPNGTAGECKYIEDPIRIPRAVRKHVRENIGLKDSDKLILFCTAEWQQSFYNDDDGERAADRFPALLASYLSQCDRSMHLVHVGPRPHGRFECLQDRYHWLAPLGERFDLMLGSSDLLLSANISSTTINKAIFSNIPVLVLQNSCRASTIEEAIGWMRENPSQAVINWLSDSLPIFPFKLWPLGFSNFLEDLLESNPYTNAVQTVEWLTEGEVLEALRQLTQKSTALDSLRHEQDKYAKFLAQLPTPAQAFAELLKGELCPA